VGSACACFAQADQVRVNQKETDRKPHGCRRDALPLKTQGTTSMRNRNDLPRVLRWIWIAAVIVVVILILFVHSVQADVASSPHAQSSTRVKN
jgi:hypothetical protein